MFMKSPDSKLTDTKSFLTNFREDGWQTFLINEFILGEDHGLPVPPGS